MHPITRPMATRRLTIRLAGAAFAAGLLLAACGSSDSATKTTDSAGATSTAVAAAGSTTVAAGPANDLVKAKKNDKLGTILADAKGLTLYTLTDAGGKAVACTGGCLGVWPPASVTAGTSAVTGAEGVDLAIAEDPSGKIITAGGLPLYTFVKDKDGEDAYGEGIVSFGGTWHAVKVGASATSTPANSGETTTTRY